MVCNWELSDIEKELEKLEALKKQVNNIKVKYSIENDINDLKAFLVDEKFGWLRKANKSTSLLEMLKCYGDCSIYKDYVNIFFNELKDFESKYKYFDVPKRYININHSFELVHDFYKQLDKEIFDAFNKEFSERKNRYKIIGNDDSDVNGYTYFVTSLNKSYIIQRETISVTNILIMLHEYGHVVGAKLNPARQSDYRFFGTEIESIFLEMLGESYLEEHTLLSDYAITRVNRIDNYFNFGTYVNESFKFCELFMNSGCNSLDSFRKKYKSSMPEIYYEIEYCENIKSNLIYLLGFMVAVELYNIYLNDKEKAIYLLKKIIKCKNYEENKIISDMGLGNSLADYTDSSLNYLKLTKSQR